MTDSPPAHSGKRFKFENAWLVELELEKVVKDSCCRASHEDLLTRLGWCVSDMFVEDSLRKQGIIWIQSQQIILLS